MWFWPKTKDEKKDTKREWRLEKADALSLIGLITIQVSSIWP